MNRVSSEIFRALHEEKWLTIKYHNKNDDTTLFWVGVKNIRVHPENPSRNTLEVEGMRLGTFQIGELTLNIARILSAYVVDGTYYHCENRDALIQDITDNSSKYRSLFNNIPTLKILDYLVECNKLDSTPERANDYTLIDSLDIDTIPSEGYSLNDAQFRNIVTAFNPSLTVENPTLF